MQWNAILRHEKASCGVARAMEKEMLRGFSRSGRARSTTIVISESHTVEVGRKVTVSRPHLGYRRADDTIVEEESIGLLLLVSHVRVAL
jgi:hypothetical protein